MKKIFILSLMLILLVGCSSTKNVTFIATIESVNENSIMVTTNEEGLSSDKASVSFEKNYKPNFELKAGQRVEITILPEVRESYPVQVTAVKIKLLGDEKTAEYKKITGEQAAQMMSGDVIVLDVRTQEEFDEGHIRDALLLPYDEVGKKAGEILPEKGKTILVYCRTGRRSEIAAKELISKGYTSVYDFGGIATDWNGEVVK
jgi:rhodanese-related sulfurtransferase